MPFAFPFEYSEVDTLGKLFYPVVHLELRTNLGWQSFEFLVDTGADITTIPYDILPLLGIMESNLTKSSVLGVGGYTMQTWNFTMPIRLGTTELLIHASAVENQRDGMPLLLGRKDVFESKLSLTLDSQNKVTILETHQ